MAHNSTIFGRLLKLMPRHEVEGGRKHRPGRMAHKLSRWSQFVAMGMARLTGAAAFWISSKPVGAIA